MQAIRIAGSLLVTADEQWHLWDSRLLIVPQVLFKWVETARVLRSGRESYAVVRINTGEDLKWNR